MRTVPVVYPLFTDILEEIKFVENEEMSKICLYEEGMDIGYINEIDLELLKYYR